MDDTSYQGSPRSFSDLTISERTSIKLQLGFIASIVAAVVAAVLVFASMRSDVIAMIARVAVQEQIIGNLQKEVVDFKIHQQSIDDNLSYLRQVIEEDQRWHRNHGTN